MQDIEPEFIISVTGPKRAGKTTFIRNMLTNHLLPKFNTVIVMSPTLKLNEDFEFLRDQNTTKFKFVHTNFKEEFRDLFEHMEYLKERDGDETPQVLVVMDDCATNPILNAGSIVDVKCIRHRHAKVSILVVGHAYRGVCGLSKSLRSQIDYAIIFNPASIMEIDTILKDCVFPEEVRACREKVKEIFSTKYNYIVYQPAETYERKLLVNFEEPLVKRKQSKEGRCKGMPADQKTKEAINDA
jgi:hypothetical protein